MATGIYPGTSSQLINLGGSFSGGTLATPLFAALGDESAPAYSYTGDTNTGKFSPGADIVAFSTGGSERVRISSAGIQFRSGTASARTILLCGADGFLNFTNAAGSPAVLQFGGTTSSFPALGRSGAILQVLTADNGGFSDIQAANYRAPSSTVIISNAFIGMKNTATMAWGSTTSAEASLDVGFARDGTSLLRVTNATTGIGYLRYGAAVAVKPSGFTVTDADSGSVFTNEAATGRADFSLPTAAAGRIYTFIVQDADGVRVIANTGDTIRMGASVSGAAGRIDSTTVGDVVTLVSINATEWIATAYNGVIGVNWTVT